jgi:LysM repeat protein
MTRKIANLIIAIPLLALSFVVGYTVARLAHLTPQLRAAAIRGLPTNTRRPGLKAQAISQLPSATLPPSTPLPTLTPSRTLKPPPTLRPPTLTPLPSATPSQTPAATLDLNVSIPGLRGFDTPTSVANVTCVVRTDWELIYVVRQDDALVRIAAAYDSTADELAEGNCLKDKNMIRIGQELRVPGKAHPVVPEIACIPFELLTPVNGMFSVSNVGLVTFDWRGPRAPRNLIRIFKPDGSKYEVVVELRQNEAIDVERFLPAGGTYTWYVYPLNKNFQQVCPEGGPWTFSKGAVPTPVPAAP